MSTQYWLLYEFGEFDVDGPYADIHRVRDQAVRDAADNGCIVQIHKGDPDEFHWSGATMVEEW